MGYLSTLTLRFKAFRYPFG